MFDETAEEAKDRRMVELRAMVFATLLYAHRATTGLSGVALTPPKSKVRYECHSSLRPGDIVKRRCASSLVEQLHEGGQRLLARLAGLEQRGVYPRRSGGEALQAGSLGTHPDARYDRLQGVR